MTHVTLFAGDWSDKSELWEQNPKIKEALQVEDSDDG